MRMTSKASTVSAGYWRERSATEIIGAGAL